MAACMGAIGAYGAAVAGWEGHYYSAPRRVGEGGMRCAFFALRVVEEWRRARRLDVEDDASGLVASCDLEEGKEVGAAWDLLGKWVEEEAARRPLRPSRKEVLAELQEVLDDREEAEAEGSMPAVTWEHVVAMAGGSRGGEPRKGGGGVRPKILTAKTTQEGGDFGQLRKWWGSGMGRNGWQGLVEDAWRTGERQSQLWLVFFGPGIGGGVHLPPGMQGSGPLVALGAQIASGHAKVGRPLGAKQLIPASKKVAGKKHRGWGKHARKESRPSVRRNPRPRPPKGKPSAIAVAAAANIAAALGSPGGIDWEEPE